MVQYFAADPIPQWKKEIPDPRRLGLIVWFLDTGNDHGMERHLLAPDRQNVSVASGDADGEPIWKVTYEYQRPSGVVHGEHWLARNKDNFPIRIEARMGDGAERFVQSVKRTVRFHEKWRVWFPEKVVFKSVQGLDSTGDEETVTVRHVSFDPIPGEVFQIGGLGLSKGRKVDFDGKVKTWDGVRLVP